MTSLLAEFDPERSGRVPLSTLLHVLAEVCAPTALSLEEVQELLKLTGVLNAATSADPRTLYAMEVAYEPFVRHLLFLPEAAGSSSRAAATAMQAAAGSHVAAAAVGAGVVRRKAQL